MKIKVKILDIKTIFIVSLPRSGSTLLQSIIMSDERAKGLSEVDISSLIVF